MKKIMISLLVFVALLLLFTYLFIPNNIQVKASVAVRARRPGLHRMLLDNGSVAKWWRGSNTGGQFRLNDLTYAFHNNSISVLPVEITGKNINVSSSLYFIPILTDSTQLEWIGSLSVSRNPLDRLNAYFSARKIKKDMDDILQKLENFYKLPENIYGFVIKNEFVKDSILIVTSANSNGYPGNEFIYSLIGKLNKYATDRSAKQAGYPMLNISTSDSLNFDVKVALPINIPLPSTGDILLKRMLGGGNILVTEVKGGVGTTNLALAQLKNYADDFERIPPAIPFFSLVTDRLTEPDSSKWITRIYYPVK
jgi:hypothetical protein